MQNENYLDEYLHLLYLDSTLTEAQLQEAFLNIDKIKDSFEKNLTSAYTFLKDYGISASVIKSQAGKSYGRIKGMIQKREDPELIAKAISDSSFGWIDRALHKIVDVQTIKEKPIAAAIALTLVVGLLNSIFIEVFGSFFGVQIGMNIVAMLVAPFLEEALKKVSILSGRPYLITGIFSGIEAVQYIIQLTLMGLSFPKVVMMRAIGILFHFGTMLVQKYFHRQSIESGVAYRSDVGYFVAVVAHSFFNIMATILNGPITKWVAKA